jgi:hypothetical protein
MDLLDVDTVGLEMLAAHCRSWAAEVLTAIPPAQMGQSCQATERAVRTVHADAATAAQSLAGRMQSTAAKLTAGAAQFAVSDQHAAVRLRGLSEI